VPVITYQEILLSSEYESESETSTDSALPLYTSSLPSSSPSPIDSLPSYNINMSQHDYPAIIRQLQEQLVAQQAQIQALLERGAMAGGRVGEEARDNLNVAKSQLFDGTLSKVSGFVTGCKLYIRNKLAEAIVEKQVQWVLSHVQGGAADIWKENIMEELELGEVEYESVEEF